MDVLKINDDDDDESLYSRTIYSPKVDVRDNIATLEAKAGSRLRPEPLRPRPAQG